MFLPDVTVSGVKPSDIKLTTALAEVTSPVLIPAGARIKRKSFRPSTAYDNGAVWALHLNSAADGEGSDLATVFTFSLAACTQTATDESSLAVYQVTQDCYAKMIPSATPTVGAGELLLEVEIPRTE